MSVVIEDIAIWQAVADIAGKYFDGRVFLAGDAVHVVPPNGGFGGNTGVHDAHNLAWKLALVLKGTAGPGLLATYDAERRPVGEFTVQQSYAWVRHPGGAVPGHRGCAPHVLIGSRGIRVSTLDLFGGDFVLLAGPRGRR
jgi:2-polyprenyl-6-methoxyphenol hydroxylase-like FAD-dependent oxidoreductase